jgi:hypothetical protein
LLKLMSNRLTQTVILRTLLNSDQPREGLLRESMGIPKTLVKGFHRAHLVLMAYF